MSLGMPLKLSGLFLILFCPLLGLCIPCCNSSSLLFKFCSPSLSSCTSSSDAGFFLGRPVFFRGVTGPLSTYVTWRSLKPRWSAIHCCLRPAFHNVWILNRSSLVRGVVRRRLGVPGCSMRGLDCSMVAVCQGLVV